MGPLPNAGEGLSVWASGIEEHRRQHRPGDEGAQDRDDCEAAQELPELPLFPRAAGEQKQVARHDRPHELPRRHAPVPTCPNVDGCAVAASFRREATPSGPPRQAAEEKGEWTLLRWGGAYDLSSGWVRMRNPCGEAYGRRVPIAFPCGWNSPDGLCNFVAHINVVFRPPRATVIKLVVVVTEIILSKVESEYFESYQVHHDSKVALRICLMRSFFNSTEWYRSARHRGKVIQNIGTSLPSGGTG